MAPQSLPLQAGRRARRGPRGALAVLALVLAGAALWFGARFCGATGPAPGTRADIVFVIDATGSMMAEIDDVKQNVIGIGNSLVHRRPVPDVRFGAVFYRDVVDSELVMSVPLSRDLPSVRDSIMDVEAAGGGDIPEHVGIGLHKALEMDWSHSGAGGVRLVYLVGDAPPKEHDDGYDVPSAVALAREMGVKVHPICVGGDCGPGGGTERAFRAIAEGTGGNYSRLERPSGGQAPHSGGRARGLARPSGGLERTLGPSVFGRSGFGSAPPGGADLLLLDVTPLSLGILSARGLVHPVIARNRVVPARATVNASTAQDNQSSVSILVYEGERPSPGGNHLVGCLTLEGIPPAPAGEPAVEVSLDIDTDGLLHVTVEHRASNASARATMANDVDRLTKEQIEALIKDSERFWEEDKSAREEIATPRVAEGGVTTLLLAPAGSDDGVGERCAALEAARAEAARAGAAARRAGAGVPEPSSERLSGAARTRSRRTTKKLSIDSIEEEDDETDAGVPESSSERLGHLSSAMLKSISEEL